MYDPNVIKRNVEKLIAAGAPREDIDAYVEAAKREADFSDVSSGASTPKPKGGFLAPIAQGATLGGADEILGGIEGLNNMLPKSLGGGAGSFSEGYARGKEKVRSVGQGFAEDHRVANAGLELAGGLMLPIPAGLGAIGKGASTGAKIARGVATGSALGAAGGALSSEEGSRGSGALGGSILGGAIGGAIPAGGHVLGEVMDEIGARTAKGVEKRAIDKLVERFGHDQKSPQRVLNEMSVMERRDNGGMLLDAGRRNVEGLANSVLQRPGPEKERLASNLTRRVKKQMPSISGAIEKGAGEAKDVRVLAQNITERQALDAKPLYDEAYAHGPVQIPAELLKRPSVKKALAQARVVAADEGVKLPDNVIDVRTIDYAKRTLDDRISALKRAGKKDKARVLDGVRRSLLEAVDEQVPKFAEARQTFAGYAKAKDALETGRKFLRAPAEETEAIKKSLTKAEQEVFTAGQQDALNELMEKVADSHDLTKKLIGNPAIRAKIRTVFPDDASYMGFLRHMTELAGQAQKKNAILGNSMTAERVQEVSDLIGIDLAKDLLTGNVVGAGRKGLGKIMGALQNKGSGKITESVGRKLQATPGSPEWEATKRALEMMLSEPKGKALPADRLIGPLNGKGKKLLPAPKTEYSSDMTHEEFRKWMDETLERNRRLTTGGVGLGLFGVGVGLGGLTGEYLNQRDAKRKPNRNP